jgi:predicted AAA+ superfamily ATPase
MVQTDELYSMNLLPRDVKQIHSDRYLVSFEKSVFRYHPKELFKEILSDKPNIHTLRAPRQVGKTIFLKLYAKRLIEEGVEPSRIFFLTCDGIKDRFELVETLKIYFQIFGKKSNQIRDQRLAIEYQVSRRH